jgi:hypothetical protein
MTNNLNKVHLLQLLQSNIWFNSFISIDNKLLNINLINDCLIMFFRDIMFNIGEKYILLYFKIQFSDGKYRVLGNLQKLNNHDYIKLSSILINLLTILNDEYKNLSIINIVITYKIIDTDNKSPKIESNNIKQDRLPTFKFYGYNLPLTMDIKKWGTILSHENNQNLVKRINSDLLYDILIEDLWNKIQIKDSNNNTILRFKDVKDINSKYYIYWYYE